MTAAASGSPRTIRWGIIGCGNVTEVKSGPGFQKARNSALVAVMRRDAALAEDYARRHNVPHWYSDAQQLIDDPEVDAIYVATPPNAHRQYALTAARAGKPVYVEKPMAMNAAECDEMIDACRAAGTPLFVAYYRRALPRFLAVQQLLRENAIGAVRFVNMQLERRARPEEADPDRRPWRIDPATAAGGHFVDLGSHQLDFLDYLFGPIEKVQGIALNQAGRYAAEDTVAASFSLAGGIVGVGVWSANAPVDQDTTEIVGELGRIRYSCLDNRSITLETAEGMREITIEHPAHVQQPLIQTMVDELNGEGKCPSTGETGARTTRVIDRILAEYREGLLVR